MKKILSLIGLMALSGMTHSYAQAIPNPGFENWSPGLGYEEPDGWVTPNFLSTLGNPVSVFKATAAADVHSGSFASKILSVVLTNNPTTFIPDTLGTMLPGFSSPPTVIPGFFYAGRPDTLFFYFKYSFASVDTGTCDVALSRTDAASGNQISIAFGTWVVDTITSAYTKGYVKLDYTSTDIPDTANIIFSSCATQGGIPGSVLFIDDLIFSDAMPTLSQIEHDTVIWDGFSPPPPVDVSTSIVAWNDSANLAGATVQISASYANGEDVLMFTNQLGITGNFIAATGTLQLTGTASFGDYQTALRSIKYKNTATSPTVSVRTVTYTATDGLFTTNSQKRYINVINTTGLKNSSPEEKKLSVYPNPAKNSLTISGDFPAAKKAEVFDALGKKMESIRWENKLVILDVHSYSPGIYFLNFIDENGTLIRSAKFSVSK